MSSVDLFKEEYPSIESYWRSIILFGRNVASYKFSLAASLLELVSKDVDSVTLQELSEPFSRNLCEHLLIAPKQGTSQSNQFLDACTQFNQGEITKQTLLETTFKKGFTYVIDAFHVVNNGEIPVKFYEKDFNGRNKKIILTDDIFRLAEIVYFNDLNNEVNARWNLVETAWELGVSRNLLNIKYDKEENLLFIEDAHRRKSVTSARDALNGYQKGKCFYCYRDITINNSESLICDVDHFFPHILQPMMISSNINGVWNLVLACPICNRGEAGKFARVPAVKYLQRLNKRNEFLISSHHPLRETLMSQTGLTENDRASFLKEVDKTAINYLLHRWETQQIGQEVF